MRRVDDLVNALRRILDRASPLVDPERDAAMDERLVSLDERLVKLDERVVKVTQRVAHVHGLSIGNRIDAERVVDSYRRADGALRR